jgi:hypothetical protein
LRCVLVTHIWWWEWLRNKRWSLHHQLHPRSHTHTHHTTCPHFYHHCSLPSHFKEKTRNAYKVEKMEYLLSWFSWFLSRTWTIPAILAFCVVILIVWIVVHYLRNTGKLVPYE